MRAKIIFFGSDKYSQIVLKALKSERNISFVNDPKQAEVGIIASYGKILPSGIIILPKQGILNIHPSLLPKYRGSSPVQTAILNGDTQTGVTIFKIDNQIDHGPIVSQFKIDIFPEDTTESLYIRLFKAGVVVLKTILPAYLEGQIELCEQNHSQATYTKKFTREDGRIDWQKPPADLERFIRAMTPWPGAWTLLRSTSFAGQAKRLKILKAHLENKKLILDQVQLEGKKPVSYQQFREGYPEAKII